VGEVVHKELPVRTVAVVQHLALVAVVAVGL
jgi:hypothetical protein